LGITDPPRPEPPQNAENQLPLVEERIMWL
jgi:hypothetical protein